MYYSGMEYTNSRGITYYLHGVDVTLKSGNGIQPTYYFGKTRNASRAIWNIPDGYEVIESPRNAMPLLRKVVDVPF